MTPIGDQANEFGVVGYCDPFVMCPVAGICLLEVGVFLEVFAMLLVSQVVFRCDLFVGFAACFERVVLPLAAFVMLLVPVVLLLELFPVYSVQVAARCVVGWLASLVDLVVRVSERHPIPPVPPGISRVP